MPIIQWSEEYALGDELIDGQHKKIFTVLNKLYDELMDDADERACTRAVERLWSIAKHHFLAEELLMTETGYDNYPEHAREHEFFIQKTLQLKNSVVVDGRKQARELLEFLSNWIIRHEILLDRSILSKPR